jgi:hypothetical protein
MRLYLLFDLCSADSFHHISNIYKLKMTTKL